MKPIDIILVILIAALLSLSVYKLISDRKKGKGCCSGGCTGNCSDCNMTCHKNK